MKKLLAALVVVSATAFLIPAQLDHRSELTVQETSAVQTECKTKKEEPGVTDWLFSSHKVPSMHFIDFIELFVR